MVFDFVRILDLYPGLREAIVGPRVRTEIKVAFIIVPQKHAHIRSRVVAVAGQCKGQCVSLTTTSNSEHKRLFMVAPS